MRYATTIKTKGGKAELIYGPAVPAEKQRADFEEATAGKGETLFLWVQGSDRPRIKGGDVKKFHKVPGKDGKLAPKADTGKPVQADKVGSAS